MQLREGLRQIVAGVTASSVFLGLFFGLNMVWWAAFVGAVLVFFAALLVIRKRPDDDDVRVADRTSKADIKDAGRKMSVAIEKLGAARSKLHDSDIATISSLVEHVESIRDQVISDPKDYRRARRFITNNLGYIVDTVERYADLSEKARGRHEDRLAALSDQIKAFVPAVEKIDTACLENDFRTLEAQIEVLAIQMKRR